MERYDIILAMDKKIAKGSSRRGDEQRAKVKLFASIAPNTGKEVPDSTKAATKASNTSWTSSKMDAEGY